MFHAIPAVHLCIFVQTYTLHSAAIAALRRALSTASVIHRKYGILHVRSEYRPVASPPCQTIEHAASSAETLSTAGTPAAPMMRTLPSPTLTATVMASTKPRAAATALSKKVRPFLRKPCEDLVNAMCETINEEG